MYMRSLRKFSLECSRKFTPSLMFQGRPSGSVRSVTTAPSSDIPSRSTWRLTSVVRHQEKLSQTKSKVNSFQVLVTSARSVRRPATRGMRYECTRSGNTVIKSTWTNTSPVSSASHNQSPAACIDQSAVNRVLSDI